jgi:hypothetical protein
MNGLGRWTSLPVALAVLGVGLGIAGAQNLHLLNTDGVAYMRLAQYWATGETSLMISGYWGPLFSWIMVPWLWLGMEPLPAARWAMGVSGVWFWLGAVRLAGAAGLEAPWVRAVAWVSIPVIVGWSVEAIVPDLLLGGCVVMASAEWLAKDWGSSRRRQIACGLAWALAYTAKAIALPLGMLVLGLGWLLLWRRGEGASGARAWGISSAVLLLAAAPWIVTLSINYGRPTFSTSAKIAHAVVGPQDRERSHPYGRLFQTPEAGRVTVWEDPSRMEYATWSPFASRAYFEHQCRLVLRNAVTVGGMIWGFGFGGVAWLGVLAVACRQVPEKLRWCGCVPVMLCGLYLPVYVKAVDHRYLEPAWPFLLVAGLGAALGLARAGRGTGGRGQVFGALFLAGMLGNGVPAAGQALAGIADPASLYAQDLAARLRRAGVEGPLAGHGLVAGGRVGVLTAFLLGRPWVGEAPGSGVGDFVGAGARVVIVSRGGASAAALAADPRAEDLDAVLFERGEDLRGYRLHAFGLAGDRVGANPP